MREIDLQETTQTNQKERLIKMRRRKTSESTWARAHGKVVNNKQTVTGIAKLITSDKYLEDRVDYKMNIPRIHSLFMTVRFSLDWQFKLLLSDAQI